MALDGTSRSDDREEKPTSPRGDRIGSPRAAQNRPRGHSGYGVESLRPFLREQLMLQDLLRRPWTLDAGSAGHASAE